MPYKSMKDLNPAIKGIEPPVTLAQANKIAECADKVEGAESPWAVCIASFKRGHKIQDGRWVRKEAEAAQMGELIPLADFAEAGDTIAVQVARPGQFVEKHGQSVVITEDDLDVYVANFESGLAGQELPIFQGHPAAAIRPEEPAAAWYKRLYVKLVGGLKTLWADIELSDLGRDLIAQKLYKYFSPSIDLENKIITGGGFVNLPAIKGMAAMELSQSQFLQEAEMIETGFVDKVRQALAQLLGQGVDFAVKTDDGEEYPERCYLYVPDADKPSTWKLRICEMVGGEAQVTVPQLGRAAAALGPGFRGRKVQLPADAKAAAKRKLIAAYSKAGVDKEGVPEYLFSEEVNQMTEEERKALEAEIREKIEAEFAEKVQAEAEMTERITAEVRAQVEVELAEKAKREADLAEFVQEVCEGGLSTPPDEVAAILASFTDEQLEAIKPVLKAKVVDFSERGHSGAGAKVKDLPEAMALALQQFLEGKPKVADAVASFFQANDIEMQEYDLSAFLPKES